MWLPQSEKLWSFLHRVSAESGSLSIRIQKRIGLLSVSDMLTEYLLKKSQLEFL